MLQAWLIWLQTHRKVGQGLRRSAKWERYPELLASARERRKLKRDFRIQDSEEIVRTCRTLLTQGYSQDDVILYLHQQGLSIIHSIRVLRILYGIGLAEGKQLVTSHAVWAETVAAHEPLHDALERILREEAARSEE